LIIHLVIAHSHPFYLAVLQNIFRSYRGIHILGRATTAAALLRITAIHKPDAIITELALPGMKGVTTLQQLSAASQKTKVILSWQHRHRAEIPRAVAAGINGCVKHDSRPAEYYLALVHAMKGKVYFCSQTERCIRIIKQGKDPDPAAEKINEKYYLIGYCKMLGYTSKEIALATGLTQGTVETYWKRFRGITGIRSIIALQRFMEKHIARKDP
jgi:two-component system, NarL family, nitrate/nitrite response regulator NarL